MTYNDVYLLLKKAKSIYFCQKYRCEKPGRKAYKYYGAIGISVLYSKNEFLIWFIDKAKDKDLSCISVGRIDHSKNYSFDNIQIETISSNVKERLERRGNPSPWPAKRVTVAGGLFKGEHTFDSVCDASRATLVDASGIVKMCRGKSKKSRQGYTFRYA